MVTEDLKIRKGMIFHSRILRPMKENTIDL
jgi:hypothetical protein